MKRHWFSKFARIFTAFSFFIFASTCSISTAHCDDCASIKDPDKRAYCRAVISNDPSHCSAIKDADLRARCRAEVKK